MIPATISALTVLGQVLLPGSAFSLEQAKQEAHSIVVATVANTGDLLDAAEVSILMWIELKPSVFLKGEASGEALNRLPLSVAAQGKERLPRVGDEFIPWYSTPSRRRTSSRGRMSDWSDRMQTNRSQSCRYSPSRIEASLPSAGVTGVSG